MAENGWGEYSKLVLTELERHNRLLLTISEKLDNIKLQQALYEKDMTELKGDIRENRDDIKDLKKRVYKLEQGELVEATVQKYRKWFVVAGFAVLTSLILPVIELVVKVMGA